MCAAILSGWFQNISSPRKETQGPFARTPLLPFLGPQPPLACALCLWIYLFWAFYINGIIPHVAFCVLLLSLSMFLWFSQVVVCVRSSCLLMAK